mgnify:CR=1 FL=1
MVTADIPRQRIEIVKKSAPYVAAGWTPSGQQLNLPLRATPLPTPAPSYGPPSPPEVETTTTEQPTTTDATTESYLSQQAENLEAAPEKEKEKLEQPQGGQFYVVLPQNQNIVYTVPRSAALLAVPKSNLMAVTPARLQAIPFSSTVSSSIYSPFSASYIQIYQ